MEIRPISIRHLAGAAALGLFLARPVTATAQNLFVVTGDINTIEQFTPGGVESVIPPFSASPEDQSTFPC